MEEKFQANHDFVTRKIAGEFILVPTGNALKAFNGLASLNDTGVFLWHLLQKPRSKKELYDCLAKEYELTMDESKNDVDDFLEPAIREHIILQC